MVKIDEDLLLLSHGRISLALIIHGRKNRPRTNVNQLLILFCLHPAANICIYIQTKNFFKTLVGECSRSRISSSSLQKQGRCFEPMRWNFLCGCSNDLHLNFRRRYSHLQWCKNAPSAGLSLTEESVNL